MTNEQAERLVVAVEKVVGVMEEMRTEQTEYQKLALGAKDNMPEQIMNMFSQVTSQLKKGK